MPRKTKLTDEFITEFCKYVSNGVSIKDACSVCGISEVTFYQWKKEAEFKKSDPLYKSVVNRELKIKFSNEIKKAEVKFKSYHLSNITNASQSDWKASAWILERKYPKEYARVDRNAVVLSSDNGILPEVLDVLKAFNEDNPKNE